MKAKMLKGFTLIECIVAMALIGITSLLMVQVYGTVAKMNRDNNRLNNSLEKQMEYVENELQEANGDSTVQIIRFYNYTDSGAKSTDVKTTEKLTFKLKTGTDSSNKYTYSASTNKTKFTNEDINADIDMYIVRVVASNDTDGTVYDNNASSASYKFILPNKSDDNN